MRRSICWRSARRSSTPPAAGSVLRHGPRPLDVDLLLYGELVTADAELRLPHPLLRERRFALQPLADVEPDLPLPPDGRTVSEVLAELPAVPGVERLGRWWIEGSELGACG